MPYGYTKHPPIKWTSELVAWLIAKAKAGQSNASIARELGVTRDAVSNKRAKLAKRGLIEPIKSHWTDEEKNRLVEMKSAGCKVGTIAKELKKTIDAVQYKINCEGLGNLDLGEPAKLAKLYREANAKFVALASEHHPEHETRL